MNKEKTFSKRNVVLFIIVAFFYLLFSLINYFYSKANGQLGLGGIITFGGGNDSFFYWNQAIGFYNNPKTTLIETSIYVPVVAYLIKLLGILDPLVIKILNYLGFLIVIFLIIKINALLSKKNLVAKNKYSMIYLIFYPSLIFMVTTGIYRDVWILVFQLLTALFYIRFLSEKKLFFVLLGFFSNYVLIELRGYAGLSMLVSFLLTIFIEFVSAKRKKQIFGAMFILFVIWYSFFKSVQLPIVNMSLLDALEYRVGTIELYSGGSTLGIRLDQPNIILFLLNYIYSFASNLIGPLINQWRSSSTLITGIVESIPTFFIILKILKKRNRLTQQSIYLLIMNIFWILAISISNDNLGTATRLRMFTYVSLMLIFMQVEFDD